MTAAVAPLPQPLQLSDSTAEARKRRREIIASQRSLTPEAPISLSRSCATVEVAPKRRKVEEPEKKVKVAKKPQMKYDPDEPMTKEEAAAWRREQRRKRNRESAAASRQRQRDRISELEVEVEDWKSKVEEMMSKIKQLEAMKVQNGKGIGDIVIPEPTRVRVVSNVISPPASPVATNVPAQVTSLVSPTLLPDTAIDTTTQGIVAEVKHEETMEQHTDKMVSRQAVKIADATPLPSFVDDSILPPDPCLSLATSDIRLEPINSKLFVKKEDTLPSLADDKVDDEFGEFLLDAVQWL